MPKIPALFIVAALTACTSSEAPVESGQPQANDGAQNGGAQIPGDKTAAPELSVVVGSVLLEQDCPDPVVAPDEPAAAQPADARPASPAVVPPPGVVAPAKRAPGAVARRACRQSTVQLQFENKGGSDAGVRVVEVRLRDIKTATVVATLPSRLPTAWSDADNAYRPWDENVGPKASVRTSYSIKPPTWSSVEGKLDNVSSYDRTFAVEVVVDSGGKELTAVSPEFSRPPVMPMPPT